MVQIVLMPFILAAKAGLRVLAVHMDNGWDTASALHNVYQLIQLPNVDYISYVLDWNKFRSIQRAFLESGVPDIELPTDIAILKAQFLTARQFGIKSILTGGNVANEGILPSSWMYNPRDMRYSESILRSTGHHLPSLISYVLASVMKLIIEYLQALNSFTLWIVSLMINV